MSTQSYFTSLFLTAPEEENKEFSYGQEPAKVDLFLFIFKAKAQPN